MVFSSRMASRIFLSLLILSGTCSAYKCFFPNGGTASNYTACSPTGDGSCCATGDYCTAFGYCVSNSQGYVYRGACTDNSWKNPSCPNYCLANTNSGNNSAIKVIACNAASTDGTWCCAYDGNCCASSTFAPVFGTMFAEATTSASVASATSSTVSVSQTLTASMVAATAATETQSTTASRSESSPSSSASNTSDKTATIVGASVGIPLGLIAVAGLVFFVMERNKRKRMERNTGWHPSKVDLVEATTPRETWPQPPAPVPVIQQPVPPMRQAPPPSDAATIYTMNPVHESPANEKYWELPAEAIRRHEKGI